MLDVLFEPLRLKSSKFFFFFPILGGIVTFSFRIVIYTFQRMKWNVLSYLNFKIVIYVVNRVRFDEHPHQFYF